MLRSAVLLLLMMLLAGVAAWVLQSPRGSSVSTLTGTDLVIDGYRPDGALQWSVTARTATIDSDVGVLTSVVLSLHSENGDPVEITAGHMLREASISTLTGNPRLRQGDRLTVESDVFYWDEANGVLESGSVTVTIDDLTVSAHALHHDLQEGVTRLLRGVHAETLVDGVRYWIEADAADAVSDSFTFCGNVRVESESGDLYEAHRLTSSSSSTLELLGDVSGQWRSGSFTADLLRIDPSGVHLQGHVTLDFDLAEEESPDDA